MFQFCSRNRDAISAIYRCWYLIEFYLKFLLVLQEAAAEKEATSLEVAAATEAAEVEDAADLAASVSSRTAKAKPKTTKSSFLAGDHFWSMVLRHHDQHHL